ncbi:Histone H3.3 type 2 [Caenorhabditis elegans]|uniref:Histone H3.3 type 2 n=1 Tax=Caenorhabditis elegans TaxID=6239 RepID=H2L2K8_CAEEL|nr:Histone H3.3 type 2 [Caenorhabditis elegans]CCE72215.1 Histone H3.3 type 2 [Caenorhabditis elegans]|eukprot:NP_001255162.1 Histone H3.3 type 2 [Caenorhabditis elegans]
MREQQWLVPSKPLVNPPEERLQESSWPPRPPANRLQPPEESRSHIVTVQELSLSVRFVVTRSRLSFSSASFLSNVSFVRLPRTSRLISASSRLPSELSRRHLKHTSSDSSRTPTCAPSTPSASPSCQRTCNSPDASAENVLKLHHQFSKHF